MRKSYMTMCFRENTEVTYIETNGEIVMTYEKAITGGFARADINLNGKVLSCDGFNNSDLDFFIRFTLKNAELIRMLVRGDI